MAAFGRTNIMSMAASVEAPPEPVRAADTQQLCSTNPHEPPCASPPALLRWPATRGFVVGAVVGIPRWEQGLRGSYLLSSTTPARVRCARCVPAASTGITGWKRSCTSAGQRVSQDMIPLKVVAPVRIRSGLPSTISTTRPVTWTNEGRRPCCVSDRVRSDPAVGGYLCPIRARVLVSDGESTARQWPSRGRAGASAGGHGPHEPRGPGPDRRGHHQQRDHPVPAAAGPPGPGPCVEVGVAAGLG
jgi:hypothetical protein